jgi:hypothetical protein
MRIAKLVSIAFVAGVAASNSAALAQAPAGATMLVPGVYTTPEISTKCQAYARQRVGGSSHNDNSRQAIALACAQKLWKHELAKGKG